MALHIIDRRLSGKNKSIGNRERFFRRFKQQIGDAVRRAVASRDIRDVERGETIVIPKRDISEPVFQHAKGGVLDTVHPGNKDHVRGDHISRPRRGSAGAAQSANVGESNDSFVFTLTKEEFMQLFFDDLALPNLLRTAIEENPQWRWQRGGYSREGTPHNLAVLRSMRNALARRIAMGKSIQRELQEKNSRLRELLKLGVTDDHELVQLRLDIKQLEWRLAHLVFLDPMDLRFRARVRLPLLSSKAVMFCLMDVSGSMDQDRKDLAKQFFILLYIFLSRYYKKIDIVFIRHHTQAQEVDEEQFFHSTDSGGTVVSSALVLMRKIMEARYLSEDWNIYGAQASDGDNFTTDCAICSDLLSHEILPRLRYFAYIQVSEDEQSLWLEYESLCQDHANFAMRKVSQPHEIYPVFHDLFKKVGSEV